MADYIGTVNNQSSTQPNGHSSHSNTTESLWRGTDYGKWFVADSCTSLSSSIQGFALPLIAQTVTGSPAQATPRVLNRSATPCLGLEVFEVSNFKKVSHSWVNSIRTCRPRRGS